MKRPVPPAMPLDSVDDACLSRLSRGLIGSEVLRIAAEVRALIASGQPLRIKSSKKVVSKESVFLAMRLAVYRKGMPINTVEQRRAAYLGSVGAGFNVENLMREALNDEMLRYMRIRLYDAGSLIDTLNSDSPG